MLRSIRIQNYALIQSLDLSFEAGFTGITGETGAGKSIFLEAMALVLGARANYLGIRHGENKCFVELEADYDHERINPLLKQWELDVLDTLIIRRELSASKRSRAFINDTPVTLQQLTEVGRYIVDLHGQQENIALQTAGYQIQQLDNYADNAELLKEYHSAFETWKSLASEKAAMESRAEQLRRDRDYIQFQFNELDEAKLNAEEYETLEAELDGLEHAEEISEALSQSTSLLDSDDRGVLTQLRTLATRLADAGRFSEAAMQLRDRVTSSEVELKDILMEMEALAGQSEADPQRLEFLRGRMDGYNHLMHKHAVDELSDLLTIQNQLEARLNEAINFDGDLEVLDAKLIEARQKVGKLGDQLHKKRSTSAVEFGNKLSIQIRELGMPKGTVRIDVLKGEEARNHGFDKVSFCFNANASEPLVPLAEVASGGEIARVMLAIKSLAREASQNFTVIFDEIDTGVSGEVASSIGRLMKSIGRESQVIAVTHLPGVASKADAHLKVFKREVEGAVVSDATYISEELRVEELASMFSGDARSEASLESARSMLEG